MCDLGAGWRPCVKLRTVCECVISALDDGRVSSCGPVDVGAMSWSCVDFADPVTQCAVTTALAAAHVTAEALNLAVLRLTEL